jgi:hypothetical protein
VIKVRALPGPAPTAADPALKRGGATVKAGVIQPADGDSVR